MDMFDSSRLDGTHRAYDKDAGQTIVDREHLEGLKRACLVVLLDRRNRAYLRRNDPKAFEQLTNNLRHFVPDVDEQITNADETEERLSFEAQANCPACADPRNETADPDCPIHGNGSW